MSCKPYVAGVQNEIAAALLSGECNQDEDGKLGDTGGCGMLGAQMLLSSVREARLRGRLRVLFRLCVLPMMR